MKSKFEFGRREGSKGKGKGRGKGKGKGKGKGEGEIAVLSCRLEGSRAP